MALTKPNTLLYYSPIFLTFLLILPCLCYANPQNNGNGLQGMFIFGSSVVDNGNNNLLMTQAKANYPPYGIDFPSGSSGRFSNGKNFADIIGDHLGLPLIPAFADPETKGDALVHGVNFASGGSGILDETGLIVGMRTTLNEQIRNFEVKTLPELEQQLKCGREETLPNYLFLLAAGNNDYLLNYFFLNTTSPQAFATRLTSAYSDQIKRLYNLGARKFLVLSVYPLGCSPVVSKGQGCLSDRNAIVSIFHDRLLITIDQIKPQLPGSQFIIVNSIKIITGLINNAQSAGFSNVTGGCCEPSLNGLSCKRDGKVCQDRKSYVYFDGQHNTEALSAIVANKAYSSFDLSEVYPINLQALVHHNTLH